MFVGRKTELEKLETFFAKQTNEICSVTGLLGMGKTALLREFVKDKKYIFLTAYETTAEQELGLLAKAVGLKNAESIEAIFDAVTKKVKKNRLVFVIDQYPNLVKADAHFADVLHHYVSDVWKDGSVKLILCADAYMLMEKYVYGKKGLWRNDIDLQLDLSGMCFAEARELLPKAEAEDLIFYYGITGGIPAQLLRLSGNDKKENLIQIFGSTSSQLPERVLSLELRELSYYNCIMSAMAQGMNRVNQLSEAVNKPKDVVVPYLNALMTIGVVQKQNAITEETNHKKTRYSIINSNMVFYYRFIVPNYDLYMAGDWDKLYKIIEPELDDFLQQVFVGVSTEYLDYLSKLTEMPFEIEKSGNWWTNDDEAGTTEGFDIVSIGKQGEQDVTICTLCFYQERQIGVADLKGLIETTKKFKRSGEIYYVVCAKDKFHENVETVASTIKNVILITLSDEMSIVNC